MGCVPPAPQTPTPLPAPGAQELAPWPGTAGVAWSGDPRGSKASELSRCVFCLLGQLAVGILVHSVTRPQAMWPDPLWPVLLLFLSFQQVREL